MKIQTKIALTFALLAGGILLAVSLFLYYLTDQYTFEDFYKRLEIRAIVAAKAALEQDATNGQAYSDIRARHLEKLPAEQEYIVGINNYQAGQAIGALPGVPGFVIQKAVAEGHSTWNKGYTCYYLLFYKAGQEQYIVMVAAYSDMGLYLVYLRRALLISFVGAIMLAFTTGFLFSKSMLRPIREITAKVRRLGANNLHLRLDEKPGKDEVSELSATFNNMLDRLETAFETQNNFVSHASHEFNTPLTAMIGEAEYALARPRTAEQYQASITAMHTAAEKLSGITRSLLQLAQTGLTGKVQEMTALRLDELLLKVHRMTDDIMPGNKVFINHSLQPADLQKLVVCGNAVLLELAITNIVLNACKYSSNKPVHLALAATRNKAIIIVKDEGVGIPNDEQKYIFDPFFRASNADRFKGYGIGLPLTRNIIRIHQGELLVYSEVDHGTEVQMILPLANGRCEPMD